MKKDDVDRRDFLLLVADTNKGQGLVWDDFSFKARLHIGIPFSGVNGQIGTRKNWAG